MVGIGDPGQQRQQPRRIIAGSFGEVSKLAEDRAVGDDDKAGMIPRG